MNRREKRRRSLTQGVGAIVIENDINFAIRHWKKELKESGKLIQLQNERFFEKPSSRRKRELEKARFRNQKALKS